jgi:hypothetical protein
MPDQLKMEAVIMTRMVLALVLFVFLALGQSVSLSADVLLIEEVRQSEKMKLPGNGLNKSDVKARFGDPVARHAAVGDPPISRWEYEQWSVYFEYDLVLFTVLHKGQAIDKQKG